MGLAVVEGFVTPLVDEAPTLGVAVAGLVVLVLRVEVMVLLPVVFVAVAVPANEGRVRWELLLVGSMYEGRLEVVVTEVRRLGLAFSWLA